MITKVVINNNGDTPIEYLSGLGAFKNGKTYEFKPGVNIIVGKNGCGKTTLMNLIRKYLLVDLSECSAGAFNHNINAVCFGLGDDKHIAKMSHAIGLDNKKPDKDGVYNAYRNGSVYNEPDNLWDELVISGFAKTKRAKDDYRYAVTQKGFQFLAEYHKIMIRYENEYEGRD